MAKSGVSFFAGQDGDYVGGSLSTVPGEPGRSGYSGTEFCDGGEAPKAFDTGTKNMSAPGGAGSFDSPVDTRQG